MKLKVAGVETIEITDPGRACGHRKKLDQGLLQKLKGQEFTSVQLKQMFGYAPNTALCDTQLANHVESVAPGLRKKRNKDLSYVEERSTKWRVI